MTPKFLAYGLVVLTFCVLTGVNGTIYCYNCNSYLDGPVRGPLCLDPISPNASVMACPSGYSCSRVRYVTQKIFVTSRSCDASSTSCNSIQNSLKSLYPDLTSFNCKMCKSNYCNGGSGMGVSLSVFVVGAILAKVF